MRSILKCILALLVVTVLIGLLGASIEPLRLAEDDADAEDDGPSFYARAHPAPIPVAPGSAIHIQMLLLRRARA